MLARFIEFIFDLRSIEVGEICFELLNISSVEYYRSCLSSKHHIGTSNNTKQIVFDKQRLINGSILIY